MTTAEPPQRLVRSLGMTLSLAQLLEEAARNSMRELPRDKTNMSKTKQRLDRVKEACRMLVQPTREKLTDDLQEDFLDHGENAAHVVVAWQCMDAGSWAGFAEMACAMAGVERPQNRRENQFKGLKEYVSVDSETGKVTGYKIGSPFETAENEYMIEGDYGSPQIDLQLAAAAFERIKTVNAARRQAVATLSKPKPL